MVAKVDNAAPDPALHTSLGVIQDLLQRYHDECTTQALIKAHPCVTDGKIGAGAGSFHGVMVAHYA